MPIVCINGMCPDNSGESPDRCNHPFLLMKDCPNAQIVEQRPRKRNFHQQIKEDEECHCGRRKGTDYMLCLTCFKALPKVMQVGFFNFKTRNDAYECAVVYLDWMRGRGGIE